MTNDINRGIRWPLTHGDLRLKIELAEHHLDVPVPKWLPPMREQLLHSYKAGRDSTWPFLTRSKAEEYENFLACLWDRSHETFGLQLTETLFSNERDALWDRLHGNVHQVAVRERLKSLMEVEVEPSRSDRLVF